MSKMHNFKIVIVSLVFSFITVSCSFHSPFEYLLRGETMGTSYSVKLVFDQSKRPEELAGLKESIDHALTQVDLLMSTYRNDSEVSQINRLEVNQALHVSPQTSEVLSEALRVSKLTNGFFDITVGPLVDLWGFGPKFRMDFAPKSSQVVSAKKRVNWRAISLAGQNLTKSQKVEIDLSAIAKGYAVDRVALTLEVAGVKNYLVEVGGEISVLGQNKFHKDWVLGIEQPNIVGRKAYTTINLSGNSLATSGDYRNYYEKNGRRYSHTIDPQTGYPVEHKLASVSVISPTCMEADALATALMAMGEREGYEFALKQGINAYFIYREQDAYEFIYTPGFKPFLN